MFDKNENVLPLPPQFETEYMNSYQTPSLSSSRAKLARTSTTLKLEGLMDKYSVHHSEFQPYSTEEISRLVGLFF